MAWQQKGMEREYVCLCVYVSKAMMKKELDEGALKLETLFMHGENILFIYYYTQSHFMKKFKLPMGFFLLLLLSI